jgi:hypothetical protein
VTTPCTLVTGVPQLVRCQGDEVRFHLVGSLEREPCFALADEEPRAVEGERSQVSERAQQVDLVRPEERRVGAGPDDERAVGHVEPEDGRIVVVERVQHGRWCVVAAENTAFAVEEEGRAGADETRQWGRTSATICSGVDRRTRSGIASRQRSPSSRRQMTRTTLVGRARAGTRGR